MPLIHFRRLTASQEDYLANLLVHMSRAGDSLFVAHCPNMYPHWATKCHMWGNSIWSDRCFEPRTSRIPCENSDHRAKQSHAPSTCDNLHLLNTIHPKIYSEPCWNRRDSPFAARSPNMDPHWATKCQRGGNNCQSSLHRLRIAHVTHCIHVKISTVPL